LVIIVRYCIVFAVEVASFELAGASIDAAIAALQERSMVVLLDRSRPPEAGYLLAAASTVTASTIATMLREAVGMPWLALPAARCDALGLTRMGPAPHADGRDMMVTFEARKGIATGISAADRALTMRVAADPASSAADVAKPGHVLPVRVDPAGVLGRCGVAEAAAELTALAGLPGGAALCQAMDDDGRPATGRALDLLAARLELPTVDTLDVLQRRLRETRLVERAGPERMLATPSGPLRCVTYREPGAGLHYALVLGEPSRAEPLRVSAHTQDPLADALAATSDSRSRLHAAIAEIAADGRGVLLYLAPRAAGAAADNAGAALLEATRRAHVVRQILRDLGAAAILAAPLA